MSKKTKSAKKRKQKKKSTAKNVQDKLSLGQEGIKGTIIFLFMCFCIVSGVYIILQSIGTAGTSILQMIGVAWVGSTAAATYFGVGTLSQAYYFYCLMGAQYTIFSQIGSYLMRFPTQGDWFDWAWQVGVLAALGI